MIFRIQASQRPRAFTLVEMALVLILFGVLLATTLPRLLSNIKTDGARKGKASVAEAREELTGYALVKGKLPAADDDGTRTLVPSDIKARIDATGQPIVYILPNVNATGQSLWEHDICQFDSTGLSVVGPGGTTSDVAFVVASPGQNHALDLTVAPPMLPGVQGAARTVTLDSFGAATPTPGQQFDDIVEFVTLKYLRDKLDCENYTPAPPGSPLATLPMDNMSDTNLGFGSGASIVSSATAGGGMGNVLFLDGTASGAVEVLNSVAYRLEEFTIMGWIKTADTSTADFEPIISRQNNNVAAAANQRNFWISLWGGGSGAQGHVPGEVAFKASPSATPGNHFNTDSDAQTYRATPYHHDGNWTFFAVTMDHTPVTGETNRHTSIVYASDFATSTLQSTPAGQSDSIRSSAPSTGATTGPGLYTMYVGQDPQYNRYFNGYIDEIVIYGYALNSTDVEGWYNATRSYY
ncbi:prepilin-type N-terminal cleavage/methylation domain-containing protein [Desulfocurvus sp.]|jgi:prepilin-type N-terminal cleavage/methylation domain-containing protein|uniref:prepilin-type N-terminal cleavage/methylation domain-containing protein n=1 Tax=Desulfocurvus sp. TaxID=2871698 RepID=UPI0025BD0260|nr:prepilin-type N-terminal cleavage/methylation domain-containing protein [Desulfocurvus sp.]